MDSDILNNTGYPADISCDVVNYYTSGFEYSKLSTTIATSIISAVGQSGAPLIETRTNKFVAVLRGCAKAIPDATIYERLNHTVQDIIYDYNIRYILTDFRCQPVFAYLLPVTISTNPYLQFEFSIKNYGLSPCYGIYINYYISRDFTTANGFSNWDTQLYFCFRYWTIRGNVFL